MNKLVTSKNTSAMATSDIGSNSITAQQRLDRRRLPRKTVTFAPKAQAVVIPNVHDYTTQQKRQMWQTPEEKKADQQELVRTVRFARQHQGPLQDDDQICTRGLEHLCSPASMSLKVRRREALNDAVLDSQEDQWQRGIFHADAEVLRRLSLAHSKADTDRAIMLAARDEAVVKALQRLEGIDTRMEKLSM